MPTTLPNAIEGSTYVVTATFRDAAGALAVPSSVAWTLMDLGGNVQNGRENVSIPPASSVTIVLSGDDLALPSGTNNGRAVVLDAVYSSSLGSNLPLRDQATFTITNLVP